MHARRWAQQWRWSAAAVAVSLHDALLGHVPWSTGLWPFNLAGVFALLLIFPDGPRSGGLWRALPRTFVAAALGLQVTLWRSAQVGGRVTGPEPAGWRLGVGYLSMTVLAASMVLAVAPLVVRYRAGTGRTRQQIRWLLLAGIVIVWVMGQAISLGGGPNSAAAAFVAAIVFLPLQRYVARRVGRVIDRDRFVAVARASGSLPTCGPGDANGGDRRGTPNRPERC